MVKRPVPDFHDISQSVLNGNWASHWLKQLSFEPTKVVRFRLSKEANESLREFRAVSKGKLGAFSPTPQSIILFIEREEDAVLLKMFFA